MLLLSRHGSSEHDKKREDVEELHVCLGESKEGYPRCRAIFVSFIRYGDRLRLHTYHHRCRAILHGGNKRRTPIIRCDEREGDGEWEVRGEEIS
jgi:hypothetical protein